MEQAVFGLIGVVVGALASGAIQALAAHRSRQLESRVAARVLYSSLFEGLSNLKLTIEQNNWGWPQDDWHRLEDPWTRYAGDLARAIRTNDFLAVSKAFLDISQTAGFRETAMALTTTVPPITTIGQTAVLAACVPDIEAALQVVWNAGLTKKELEQQPKPPVLTLPATG